MRNILVRLFLSCFFAGTLLSCQQAPKTNRYGDTFLRSTPEAQGMASEGIVSFLEAVETESLELHSLMILRHGRVVTEAWWYPYQRNINHIMHSASKTFTSTAIGFAVQDNLLTVDDKVISFFPDDLPAEVSPNLQQLTVKDLLTMSVGHAEAPTFYIDNKNWVRSFLAVPIVYEPGARFLYNSAASYMLSAIITKVTGKTAFEYLNSKFFEPLAITDIQWETDPNGISIGGGGLRMKTSHLASLGQFYLDKGVWRDKQLLPASWIEEAASPHIYQHPERTAEENANDESAQGYGYQLWMCTHDAYRADGAFGQLSIVMPKQDAVVTITARVSNIQKILKLVFEHLQPAMLDRPLKPDEATNEQLISHISSLQIKSPFRTPEDTSYPREGSYNYQIEPNDLGVQSLTFHYDKEGNCTLSQAIDGQSYDFNFGQDSWMYGETEKKGPYYLNPRRNPEGLSPFLVSGYSSWTQPEELSLRLYYLTEIQYETYICSFEGDKVTVRYTNSTSPDEPPVILVGQKH